MSLCHVSKSAWKWTGLPGQRGCLLSRLCGRHAPPTCARHWLPARGGGPAAHTPPQGGSLFKMSLPSLCSWCGSHGVLVCSGHHTEFHRLCALTEMYFSQFWRLGGPKSRCWLGRCHSEASSLGWQAATVLPSVCMTSSCVCRVGRVSSLPVSSYKDTSCIGLGLYFPFISS